MTFLLRSSTLLRPASRAVFRPAAGFHTSASRKAMSEQDRDDPDRDAKIDHHKADSVQKAKGGKGEWKPELASSSEQAVQQEKNNMSMDEMTKMGEKKAEKGETPSGSGSSKVH